MSLEVRNSWCYHAYQLFLFSFILLLGCAKKQDTSQAKAAIVWKNNQPIALSIPLHTIASITDRNISERLQVRLVKTSQQPAILGDYTFQENTVVFTPLIPFTYGLHYEVILDNKPIAQIAIPHSIHSPVLLGVYPSQDTLPENLLKFYFIFSHPMTEGHSLQYITLLDAKGDTLSNTFLNLQPELWNEEKTTLTLWLDPGRIKRDLQPNKTLGAPLKNGNRYQLVVADNWPDAQGTTLSKGFSKDFIVTTPDVTLPKVEDWHLKIPQKNTKQPFMVDFGESLDYILLQNTFSIIDNKGVKVEGTLQLNEEEKIFIFTPQNSWQHGTYNLQVEARLEDLAGNNLRRLFDRDLSKQTTTPTARKKYERQWQVK